MITKLLSANETNAYGYTHAFKVTYADTTTANAVHAQTLITLQQGQFVEKAGYQLVTDFASTSDAGITSVTLSIGNSSSATVYAAAKELMGTEIDFWYEITVTPETGGADQDAETEAILATFTAANGGTPLMSEMTSGEVHIYLRIVGPPSIIL